MFEGYFTAIDEHSEKICGLADWLWEHPALLEQARTEHKTRSPSGYICPNSSGYPSQPSGENLT